MASVLYTMGWSFGEFAGPLLGAQLVPNYGFQRTGGILGISLFGLFLVYVVYAIHFNFSKSKKNKIKEETLQNS
jgi:hypothetical protein